MVATRKRATYEDVLAAPEHMVAEIIDGELGLQPRPRRRHASAASVLGMDLGTPFHRGRGGPGGWIILDEPELHFDDDVLVPDLAGWHRERMTDDADAAYFTLAPDWVCEVLSPSTTLWDRRRKMPVYAREGVRHAWLVDPGAQTLEVFRLQDGHWLLQGVYAQAEQVRAVGFEAVELDLAALWEGSPGNP